MHNTRERIVQTASLLLQRQGYEGTGIKQIASESGAALGSLYHFFPGGKQELAVAAIRHGDQEFTKGLQVALDSQAGAVDAIIACTSFIATGLRSSDWQANCVFSATALETAGRATEIRQAIAEAVKRWQDLITKKLQDDGINVANARELACTVINLFEGAALACQIAMNEKPLEIAGRHLARLVDSFK